MNGFCDIDKEKLEQVNGGGLAGAFVGVVFGAGAGMLACCAATAISGNPDAGAHIIWKTTKKGITSGAIAGFLSPM